MKFIIIPFRSNLLTLMVFFCAFHLNAQTTDTIALPEFDSEIRQALPLNNFSTQSLLTVHPGLNPGNSVRFLTKFTIPELPSNSYVLSAKVRLYTIAAINTTSSRTVAIHRVTNNWDISNVSWNKKDGANWTNAGGDFVSTATSTTPSASPLNWIELNVTADVLDYISNPENNKGWLIKYNNEDNSGLWWAYASSEYLGGIYAPQLVITYSSTLPITLKSFDGAQVNDGISLEWITSKEKNNEYFELERSNDGKSWIALGKISGAGDADFDLKYEFLDRNPLGGNNYYRIRQYDFDGKSSYSHNILVNYKEVATINWITTNNKSILADIYSEKSSSAMIRIYDVSGRLMMSRDAYIEEGLNSIEFRMDVSSGIYFYEMTVNQQVVIQKIFLN